MKKMVRYEIDDNEREVLRGFLSGKLSTRLAGARLKMSHTNIINMVAGLAREYYQKGKWKL